MDTIGKEQKYRKAPGTIGGAREWWAEIKAHYDCNQSFSETDFTEDLKSVDVPVLVMHGEDDQIVPFPPYRVKAVKLLKNGKLSPTPASLMNANKQKLQQ